MGNFAKRSFLLAALLLIQAAPAFISASYAGEIPIGALNINPNFKSLSSISERRFERVEKQKFDYSCGSASVATLLTFHYGKPVDEKDVIKKMLDVGDEKKIMKEGFSLLDMKKYLLTLGFVADGFRAPLSKLEEVGIPAIVLLNINNYLHFVVIKGINDRGVLVGDPTLGVRLIKKPDFEASWNGILFVITNADPIGKKNFNRVDDWGIISQSALTEVNQFQSLSSFTIHTNLTPNYY